MTDLSTFEFVRDITPETQAAMISHFEETLVPLLTPDVSSYAKGRERVWLQAEPTLTRNYSLTKAHGDDRIWSWIIKQIWPQADIGLVTRGPVGIGMHRDATYAGWTAYAINLGEDVTWGYRECYKDYCYGPQDDNAPVTEIKIKAGQCFKFNPKNQHGVLSEITDKRWSINLWELKK
jgi:hypothetical protein